MGGDSAAIANISITVFRTIPVRDERLSSREVSPACAVRIHTALVVAQLHGLPAHGDETTRRLIRKTQENSSLSRKQR